MTVLSSKPTKTQRLYTALSDGQWHTTQELVRVVGHTFSGAKFRLVHHGYVIKKRRHPTDQRMWQYHLAGEPSASSFSLPPDARRRNE
jgi:hypothetical protein